MLLDGVDVVISSSDTEFGRLTGDQRRTSSSEEQSIFTGLGGDQQPTLVWSKQRSESRRLPKKSRSNQLVQKEC
jgi:hypothetical protein